MITAKLEGVSEFNRDMQKVIRRSNISTDIAIKKIAMDLLANILKAPPKGRHPVKTGRSRAAWYPSLVGLNKGLAGVKTKRNLSNFDFNKNVKGVSKVSEGKRKGEFVDKSKGLTRLNKYIEMINNVSYIIFLEYGWSAQAPFGMVRISMRKMRGKLPKELDDGYRREWNKLFWKTRTPK